MILKQTLKKSRRMQKNLFKKEGHPTPSIVCLGETNQGTLNYQRRPFAIK